MATPANVASNANPMIAALRGNTGPMSNNPGVTSWQFDYTGTPIGPRTRTPGGANNPDVLELPTDLPATPETPVAPDPIEQPIQVDVPIVDIPAPPPTPDPVPEPEDDPVIELGGGDGDDGPSIDEVLDDMDWGDTDVSDDVVELGGGEGTPPADDDFIELGGGEGDKVGTVTIEDFTRENPAVIPNNDAPVIRDILNEQIDEPVGTVTIESVDDTNVSTIDQEDNDPYGWDRYEDPNIGEGDIIDAADNDPFGWDEWLDPVSEDPIIITAQDNDPFGWDQWEGPDGGDDTIPVPSSPSDEELEELMLALAGF